MSFYFPSWGMQVWARAELLDRVLVVKNYMEKGLKKHMGRENFKESKPDEKDVWGLLLFCCGV